MLLIKNILILCHIITAASWFGLGLRVAAQGRLALDASVPVRLAFLGYLERTLRLMGVFIVLTFIFGIGTFMAGGSVAVYGPPYHTAMTLVLLMVGVHFALTVPTFKKLSAALHQNGDGPAAALPYQKRLAMLTGLGHLAWLVVLVLMFWPRISAALQAL